MRERPSGAIGPIPGDPVSGFLPTLALAAALLFAIIATTAGAVSLARNPRTTGDRPRAPGWERSQVRLKLTYIWLAIAVLVIALMVTPFAQRKLADESTETRAPARGPGAETQTPSADAVPEPPGEGASPVFAIVILAIVAAFSVVVLIATWRTVRNQRRIEPPRQTAEEPVLSAEPLIRATELALKEVVEPDRPPREAIIACFATMEHALEDTEFAPLDSDTAKEVIERAVGHGLMPDAPAETLRELFTEARFSPHEMTASDRDSARMALNDALEGLRR